MTSRNFTVHAPAEWSYRLNLQSGQSNRSWAGEIDGAPAHEVLCEICNGRLHLLWDRETCSWGADGDLVVLDCETVHSEAA